MYLLRSYYVPGQSSSGVTGQHIHKPDRVGWLLASFFSSTNWQESMTPENG